MSTAGFADEGPDVPPPLPHRTPTAPVAQQWACTRDEFVAALGKVWPIAEPWYREMLADAIGENLPSLPPLTAVSDHKCHGDCRKPHDVTRPGPCEVCGKPWRRMCLEADLAAVLAELSKEPWPPREGTWLDDVERAGRRAAGIDPADEGGLLSALGGVVFQHPPAVAVDGQGAANGTTPVSPDGPDGTEALRAPLAPGAYEYDDQAADGPERDHGRAL